ncbi:ubiquitin carboxyl-terminal hydrolase 38 isoform X3 [Emydura macquarii macquarii]|uniref:ubiquitin carboxyl-terminal hydrolase 38 isoform X3 n=1 Tax=Emydura macquarii macquarii TaxID=1129001 RepID=UPI00352B93FE
MDKILEGLVSSSHPLPLKRVIVRRVVESAETPLSQAQCRAMFALSTRLILQGPDPFQRQVGRQVLEAYARFHRAEFEAFFNRGLVLGLLQRGYGGLGSRDPAILDYIQAGLRLIISCPSVLELFALLQVEALRMVCERPAPPLCARLCQLLDDFPQCLPRGRKLSLAFCQQLVRSIAHFQSQGSREPELRLYVSQVTQVSGLLRSIWKGEPDTLLPSLQELFAVISSTDTSFEPSVALASLVQHIPLQMITVLIRSLTTDPNVKDASMTQALCRMIDWLSWPLAQHVETWVIALLKGLAAVQKFTILIDVTLLKIELVFNRLWFPLVRPGALAVLSHMLLSFQHSPEAFHLREAYAPRIFFEASRPPWFTPRSQQDCSEYLRFLLDRLHEEERTLKALSSAKPSENMMNDESLAQETASKAQLFEAPCTEGEERTLIEKMFGGKLQTNICCLNCKSTSQKEEPFTDLSLAFCPPTSLENVDMQSIAHSSEVKDDCMVQTSIVASSSVEESALDNSLPVSDGCETVRNEGILRNLLPAELSSENITDFNLYKVQDSKDMSQKPVSENTPSVTDLLNYFLAPEILNGDNKYYCEKCASLQNAEKTMQIMEEPEYLILTLLRFSYDPKCHIRRKILDNVSLPLILELPIKRTASSLGVVSRGWSVDVEFSDTGENLAKKLKPSRAEEVCCPQLVPYVLSSVVVHSGISSESGHYYSYARNITGSGSSLGLCHQSKTMALTSHSSLLAGEISNAVVEHDLDSEMSKEWFLFNDSRVTFTSFQSVQKITSRFPKDTAYVLLYKKQNGSSGFDANSANGLWVNGDPPLQKELMDAITKDNKLYLQEQELSARTQALQAASASCSFRPNGFDDNDPPGSCGPTGGGGGGGFSTIGRLVF